jgi:RNA polymerase sigma-70 factor (ECF subfamily)
MTQSRPAQTPNRDEDNRQLLLAIADGDRDALETLYARYSARILAYLIGQLGERQLAEEVLQDVMLAVWQGAERFRGESAVYTWMLTIARNQAISIRRRKKPPPEPLDATTASQQPSPALAVEQEEQRDHILAAIRQLPPEQRETLELVFYHDLSGPDVATLMGVALGTVKSRLHRAKQTVGRLLQLENQNNA